MSERCCKTWRKEWITQQCSRRGKVERDGKWYCAQHDPVEVKKRRDKSYRELCAKLDSEEAQRKFEKSAIAACTGMTDPAAEIAAKDAEIARLRHELADAIDVANALRTALNDHDNAENFRALHDEAQEEIESLRLQLYDANAHANDFKHDCEEYRAEIAKLRAEIELLKSYRKVEEEDRLAARHSLYQEIRDVLKSRGLHVSAFAKLADKEGQSNLIGDVARAIEKLKQDNEALKAHVREQGEKYTSAWADAEKLRAQVERMRGALEFYASPGAWCGRDFIVPGQVLPSEAENDRGKMARAALEGRE